MALPIEDRRLQSTPTRPIERTQSAPTTPAPTPPATSPSAADRSDARKGAEARKATDKVKKDPVNNAIIGAVETVKTTARDIGSKASEIKTNVEKTLSDADKAVRQGIDDVKTNVNKAVSDADKAVRSAAESVKKDVTEAATKAAAAAAPLLEPTVREAKEAGQEISSAAKKTADSWNTLTNLDEHPEVEAVRNSDLDGVNKSILIAKEKLENGVQAGWDTLNNADKVVGEVLEGAFEVAINNPFNTAVVKGGKAALDGAKELGSNIGGWFSDRISGGAEGAVKAGKTASETSSTIDERSKAQQAENDREIGAASDKLGDSWNNLNPSNHAEVEAVRNSDLDDFNKDLLIAKETVENGIQNGFAVLNNVSELGDEYLEAGAENIVTAGENLVDGAVGAGKAVGNFVGGLFG